jgi:SAM-dependent methyltransferase
MAGFRFPADGDIAEDLRQTYGYSGDMAALYCATRDGVVHKQHHYLPLYDRYLAQWRGTACRVLEIGVSKGGSLSLWRRWFGPSATIFGIDIDPRCARHDGVNASVRIGDQADLAFLNRVVDEMGGLDVVLDDGSHRMADARASFDALFPRLAPGGIYLIEDMHSAYWQSWGGGLGAPGNIYRLAFDMVDDMHHWYHGEAPHDAERAKWVTGVHVHDSMLLIEKQPVHRPRNSIVGVA